MSVEEENLKRFTNGWFLSNCTWKLPDANEISAKNKDALLADISKAIIGMRPNMSKYREAINAFHSSADHVISAQLDSIALKFDYAPGAQAPAINSRKTETLQEYDSLQTTLAGLNKNLGLRASAAIHLIEDEKTKIYGKNLLSIMNLLNAREASLQAGNIKCGLMKFSMSMCNELKRSEYSGVVKQLEKEVGQLCEKVKSAIEKIPAGVVGKLSVKDQIASNLQTLPPNEDETIKLIQVFDITTEQFCKINTTIAQKLAGLAIPIEKEHGVISIAPSQS